MLHRYRFARRPGWIVLHVVAIALVVTMVILGRWQLDVSDSKHFDLQNFGYALQWWAFSAFVIGMWLRFMRDARVRADEESDAGPSLGTAESQRAEAAEAAAKLDEPVAYRRYVMPNSAQSGAPAGDAELASYNDYLSRLAQDADTDANGEVQPR